MEAFPFLVFEKPKYNQCFYDFKINNIPVQEKTAIKRNNRKNSFVIGLYRHGSNKSYKAYKLGMNKFYWINIPDTSIFFVFTETILFQNGYIEDHNTTFTNKPMVSISLSFQDGWYQKYRYDYDNIDKNIFKEMFELH